MLNRAPVLRSVHLPADLDDQVRRLAFDARSTNSDVMRKLIQAHLEIIAQKFGTDVDAIEQYLNSIVVPGNDQIKAGFESDVLKIKHAVELAGLEKKNA
jgi:hypothetical protein